MEFYREVAHAGDVADLQRAVTVAKLPRYNSLIDRVLRDDGERGEIYCLWGQFRVHRETLKAGLRFTLPDCPNALAWTITLDPAALPGVATVHCTINRREHDPDFIESIELFVDAMGDGLAQAEAAAPANAGG